ncbi:MAG: ABC transporter ATP-binding protein [Actinobacteria bacterium]|nr:ABC transporter ATP-binding protein [Actinomycetota bacterium]
MSEVLCIDRLRLEVPAPEGPRLVLSEVSLAVNPGEAVGLVGESGSGKSMTARSILRLLPAGSTVSGAIACGGREVLDLDRDELRRFRATEVGMVFQDPRTHMNPVRTIGDYLTETLVESRGVRRAEALLRVTRILGETGIDDPERRLRQYPHELSGGLLQRVAIAAVLAAEPGLIIADEPTTALDVTTQSEVMAILDELRKASGVALLFITHDLDLAAAVCDRMSVMYAGMTVEERDSKLLQEDPLHPYSAALIASRPPIEGERGRLEAIPGRAVAAYDAPPGCPFAPRCPYVADACRRDRPRLAQVSGARVACLRAGELSLVPGSARGEHDA